MKNEIELVSRSYLLQSIFKHLVYGICFLDFSLKKQYLVIFLELKGDLELVG